MAYIDYSIIQLVLSKYSYVFNQKKFKKNTYQNGHWHVIDLFRCLKYRVLIKHFFFLIKRLDNIVTLLFRMVYTHLVVRFNFFNIINWLLMLVIININVLTPKNSLEQYNYCWGKNKSCFQQFNPFVSPVNRGEPT